MDEIEKATCLFVFKSLFDFINTHYGITTPVYDNTQPSKSFEKRVFSLVFHDSMLSLIPHTANGTMYDFKTTRLYILFTIMGRYWPTSGYQFVSELDYVDTMKSVQFQVEPSWLSQRQLLNDLLANYIGYGLITKAKCKYVIDTRYLKQFEVRDGYSRLDCLIVLDEHMRFHYCKINGRKRVDDLAIRECMTAIATIITLEKHLFQIHLWLATYLMCCYKPWIKPTPSIAC